MRPVDAESLMVAMAVAPGVYARNRLFSLFERPEVRRARKRASVIRGIVRQLSGADGEVEVRKGEKSGEGYELVYRIAEARLERRVLLSPLEAACVGYVLLRATGKKFDAIPEEHDRVVAALRALTGDEPFAELHEAVRSGRQHPKALDGQADSTDRDQ